MQVRIERLEAARVAARTHEGPYEGLADVVDGLVRWLRAQKETGGAVTTLFQEPAGLEAGVKTAKKDEGAREIRVRAEVWVPVVSHGATTGGTTGETEADPATPIKHVPDVDAACVTYTGDPLGIPQLALALRVFLETQGYRLKAETRIVHLMPDWEDPANWVAEVQVPIATGPGSTP